MRIIKNLQFHCLTEGDSFELFEIYKANNWTTCNDYDEWVEAGGEWDIFDGDPDMLKIQGDINYFIKLGKHVFYTAERYTEEYMIEGILSSFFSNGEEHNCGYYSKFFNNRPVNPDIQNWDAWDKMENAIAYRGGSGYNYEFQHLRDPYGRFSKKTA